MSSGSTSVQSYGFGVSADFFLNHNRFTDGIILTVTGGYALLTAGSLSASGLSLGPLFGYAWFWDSGFNLGLQGGFQYTSAKIAAYSTSAVTPALGFQIGYAF